MRGEVSGDGIDVPTVGAGFIPALTPQGKKYMVPLYGDASLSHDHIRGTIAPRL